MFTNEVVTGAQLYIPVNIPMYSHYIPIFPGLPLKSHEISPFPIGFWHCSLGSASPWNPLPHSYLSCSSVVPCDTGMVKTCKDWMDVFFFEKTSQELSDFGDFSIEQKFEISGEFSELPLN